MSRWYHAFLDWIDLPEPSASKLIPRRSAVRLKELKWQQTESMEASQKEREGGSAILPNQVFFISFQWPWESWRVLPLLRLKVGFFYIDSSGKYTTQSCTSGNTDGILAYWGQSKRWHLNNWFHTCLAEQRVTHTPTHSHTHVNETTQTLILHTITNWRNLKSWFRDAILIQTSKFLLLGRYRGAC